MTHSFPARRTANLPSKTPNIISFGFSYPLCSQLGTRRSSATSTSSCRVEHNWQKRTAGLGRRRASGCFIIYWNSSRNFLERWRHQLDFPEGRADRKSVVSGKSVAVRLDLGGRRYIKKKK